MSCVRLKLVAHVALAAALTFSLGAAAQTTTPAVAPPTSTDAPMMDTVLVTGEQPGPGFWKVSKGDHVLWIFGTWSPLPKTMTWRTKEASDLIATSQEVLMTPAPKVEIGFFRRLTLIPAVFGARKNADGARLEDILTPELYARWTALKARYIGRDNGVERQRPTIAAFELYSKALRKSDLTLKNHSLDMIEQLAKQHGVKVTEIPVDIPVDDPRQAIREFENTPREAEVACLASTMQRLETDIETMKARANAWASGDLETLCKLPYKDQNEICLEAISSAPGLRERIEDARRRVENGWIAAAEAALGRNASTFAVAPMTELMRDDGPLTRLRADGYAVEAPQ